jgi:cell division protein FtsQ
VIAMIKSANQATSRSDTPTLSVGALLMRLLWAVLLFAVFGFGGWLAYRWEPRLLPIRVVNIDGELQSLSRDQLQQTIAASLQGGLLTQNLITLRKHIEALPWVEHASLRRQWPDRLELTVRERRAVARWNEFGLITQDAVIFYPNDQRIPAGLAQLSGPVTKAPELLTRFLSWQPRLAELGLLIDALYCDHRGDWRLIILGGAELFLGTEFIEDRFNRLLYVYPYLESFGDPVRIDLRYGNGLAVSWKPTAS